MFSLLLFFFLNVREAMWFPSKIKSWVAFGLPYLLIELFYFGMPVVRMDGRCTVTWLPNFLGWIDHHISLAMGLHPRAVRSAARGAPLLESRSSSRGGLGCAPPAPFPQIHPWCSSFLNDVPLPSSSWFSLVVRIIKRRRINRWINFTYNSLEVACVHPPSPLRKEGDPVRFFLGEGAGLLTLIANRFDTLTVKQWKTDKQWCYCFLRPLRKHLTSSSYITLLHGSNLRLELFTTDKDTNCYVKKVCKIPLY